MSLTDFSQELVVTGMAFAQGSVEITYLEKREQGDTVGMMRTLFLDTTSNKKLAAGHADMLETAVDMVEEGLLILRNPEPQLDPRKRFRAPRMSLPEDDEADLS